MSARHAPALPLPVAVDRRRLDRVTVRAIRAGMLPGDESRTVTSLVAAAGGDHAVLSAAIDRIERALTIEWSRAADHAARLLRVARARVEAGTEELRRCS